MTVRTGHSLDPAVNVQFCHQSLDVVAYGGNADVQALGYDVRRLPIGHQAENFTFPLGQQTHTLRRRPGRSNWVGFAVEVRAHIDAVKRSSR